MLNINLGERCRKTGGAKTLKCDEKLVRLEETYGDWVKQEKENCRLSSGAMDERTVSVSGIVFSDSGE